MYWRVKQSKQRRCICGQNSVYPQLSITSSAQLELLKHGKIQKSIYSYWHKSKWIKWCKCINQTSTPMGIPIYHCSTIILMQKWCFLHMMSVIFAWKKGGHLYFIDRNAHMIMISKSIHSFLAALKMMIMVTQTWFLAGNNCKHC